MSSVPLAVAIHSLWCFSVSQFSPLLCCWSRLLHLPVETQIKVTGLIDTIHKHRHLKETHSLGLEGRCVLGVINVTELSSLLATFFLVERLKTTGETLFKLLSLAWTRLVLRFTWWQTRLSWLVSVALILYPLLTSSSVVTSGSRAIPSSKERQTSGFGNFVDSAATCLTPTLSNSWSGISQILKVPNGSLVEYLGFLVCENRSTTSNLEISSSLPSAKHSFFSSASS